MSTISHDIVPLPYLPEGGAFFAPPSPVKSPSAALSTRATARTPATCGLAEDGTVISGTASGSKAELGNSELMDGNKETGINAKLTQKVAEMVKEKTPGNANLTHGAVMPILAMITLKTMMKNLMEIKKRTRVLKKIRRGHTHRKLGHLSMRPTCGMPDA